jgi:alpha-galactosidase
LFILNEAPTSIVLAYPGGDFLVNSGNIRLIGVGMQQSDLDLQEWKKAYGFVTGVYGGNEVNKLLALRDYQQRIRIHRPNRDEMIMMNTWGDRGQDTKVNEAFCLDELDAGARLGITHFQLDDGYQRGSRF